MSPSLIAIETATDACSVALSNAAGVRQVHRIIPRQHNQQLFPMLREVLQGVSPAAAGLDGIVYGSGPGSFTGLRIAASAAQGLAFSCGLPAIGISTLAAQAATFLRREPEAAKLVLSLLDARIGEVYWAVYRADGPTLSCIRPPAVCAQEALPIDEILALAQSDEAIAAVGSGVATSERVAGQFALNRPDLRPEARDLLPLGAAALAAGRTQAPHEIVPLYVQDTVGWKKLHEQGRPGS
jgi:tRNA threonylcarbamoyladenosine biosynthesis protein TsaB